MKLNFLCSFHSPTNCHCQKKCAAFYSLYEVLTFFDQLNFKKTHTHVKIVFPFNFHSVIVILSSAAQVWQAVSKSFSMSGKKFLQIHALINKLFYALLPNFCNDKLLVSKMCFRWWLTILIQKFFSHYCLTFRAVDLLNLRCMKAKLQDTLKLYSRLIHYMSGVKRNQILPVHSPSEPHSSPKSRSQIASLSLHCSVNCLAQTKQQAQSLRPITRPFGQPEELTFFPHGTFSLHSHKIELSLLLLAKLWASIVWNKNMRLKINTDA